MDPNAKEYRSLVGIPNQHQIAVGALIEETCLGYVQGSDRYTINVGDTYGQTLDYFMGQVTCFKQAQNGMPFPNPIPHITKGYKFNDCIIVANSTCFYIGNGLIVTAGHCVFEGAGPAIKAIVPRMKVVFGLTNANCSNKAIPKDKVFGIERVCFGQNEPFGPQNQDRADWAILKLAVDPESPLLPPPLALRRWAYGERINGAWIVGHPWGIGLTLSSPPEDKGYASTAGANSLATNLWVAPANSGGPLFSKDNEIIGIVASGMSDVVVGRGFYWIPPAPEITPFIAPNQTFGATKTNICRALTHTDVACFIGLQLPANPAPPDQKNILVELLYGNGADEHAWTAVTIINQQAPANPPLDRFQLLTPAATIVAASPNFRPWLIRALRVTFTFPNAANAGIGGGGRGGFQLPTFPALMFGCMDAGDGGKPENWTVLMSQSNFVYQPGAPNLVECPVWLSPSWKTVVNGALGPIDLALWQAPSRPRK